MVLFFFWSSISLTRVLCLFLAIIPQTADLAEKALRVDPYSGAAYGALVFVLCSICYLLWKELKRQQMRHQDHLEKTLGVLQMIESRLPTLVEMDKTLNDIERTIESVKNEVDK